MGGLLFWRASAPQGPVGNDPAEEPERTEPGAPRPGTVLVECPTCLSAVELPQDDDAREAFECPVCGAVIRPAANEGR
jgi:hypothetical protein